MYRFKSTHYLVTTALLTAIIFVVGFVSHFISFSNQKGIFQISDAILVAMASSIDGPMMLFVGPISGGLIDISSSAIQYLPATLLIHFLIPLSIIGMKKICKYLYLNMFLSSWLTLLYSLYELILFPILGIPKEEINAFIITDLFINLIQIAITFILGSFIYWQFNLINSKSGLRIWDNSKFEYLKIKSKKN